MVDLVPVDHQPEFEADQAAMMPETYANPMIKAAIEQMASLPRRAIENSQQSLNTGNYDPGPTLEAATLPMGMGAIAGVPLRAGEAVLGAGPLRPYQNVPDSLMGFSKKSPSKSFEQDRFPLQQEVQVSFPDSGQTFEDSISGLNKSHALERAKRNWEGAGIEPMGDPYPRPHKIRADAQALVNAIRGQ